MKYACLVYQEFEKIESASDAEMDSVVSGCASWVQELEATGQHVISMGLQNVRTSTSVRSRNGKLVITDGPFAETKEFLGGFTVIEARDLNEALQIAAKMPVTRIGTVEVRPVFDMDVDPSDPLDQRLMKSVRRANGHCPSVD